MAVIKAGSSQFPFHITDIAALLRLNIRRRGPDFLYVDCPLCGDHRGKLYLKTSRDVWHCNYCQESGGMLALYAKVYGISNADAYAKSVPWVIWEQLKATEDPDGIFCGFFDMCIGHQYPWKWIRRGCLNIL